MTPEREEVRQRVFQLASARELRVVAVLGLQLLSPPSPSVAQTLPEVPPLQGQERLLERNDLAATLLVRRAELTAGERPQLTLVLTNRAQTQLRVPNAAVNLTTSIRAFDSNGNAIPPRLSATIDRWVFPTSVHKLPALAAGRSMEFPLGGDWGMPDALPVGDYVFRATYVNRAGMPELYDVRERGAEEVWEGELTASVAIRVRPVDPASEQGLIEQVRDGDRTIAVAAMGILGLSRAAVAVDAIVDRFERDYSTFPTVLASLGYIGTPHAARALAAAHRRMPQEIRFRYRLFGMDSGDVRRLLQGAGCDALALGPLILPTRESAEDLRRACRDATDLVRTEVRSREQGQALTGAEAERQKWAVDMLKWLESPPPPPSPTVWPEDKFPPPPVAERLPEYAAAIIGFPGGHSESVKVEMSGIARFGTHDTFRQLRAALSTAGEVSAYVIGEALVALTFDDDVVTPADRAPHPDRSEELRRWDRWWQQHQRQSREQWAREAIAKRPALSTIADEVTGASRAAEYLLVLNRPRYERALITHPSWRVRIRTAVTLAANDPRYAAALLLREFENRYLTACFNASSQLASLTETWFPFDCSRQQERRAAAAHWTRMALELRD
jgi:hypothetical protein